MACTCNIPQVAHNPAANSAPKGKRSCAADDTDMADTDQPAPGKKAKTGVSKSKRQHKVDDPPSAEPEQVATTKKTRTRKDPRVSEHQVPAQCSERAHTILTAPPKRKRQTKNEIAADKAKAEEGKKRQEELTQENQCMMAQMDINEDLDRAETAAQTIRTFSDHEDHSGEEFVGYGDIEESESELDGEAEEALKLKVRFLSWMKAKQLTTTHHI